MKGVLDIFYKWCGALHRGRKTDPYESVSFIMENQQIFQMGGRSELYHIDDSIEHFIRYMTGSFYFSLITPYIGEKMIIKWLPEDTPDSLFAGYDLLHGEGWSCREIEETASSFSIDRGEAGDVVVCYDRVLIRPTLVTGSFIASEITPGKIMVYYRGVDYLSYNSDTQYIEIVGTL